MKHTALCVVAVLALTLVACSQRSGVGVPCATAKNCPDDLVCTIGKCAIAPAGVVDGDGDGDEGEGGGEGEGAEGEGGGEGESGGEGEGETGGEGESGGEGEGEGEAGEGEGAAAEGEDGFAYFDEDEPLVFGARPRVIAHDGVVDVFFPVDDCDPSVPGTSKGVVRWRPLDGAAAIEGIAFPTDGCADEADVGILGGNIVGVLRAARTQIGRPGVGFFTATENPNGTVSLLGSRVVSARDGGDRPGQLPHVATSTIAAQASWLVEHGDGSYTIEATPIVATVSHVADPTVQGLALVGRGEGLASTFNGAGAHAVFDVDEGVPSDAERLDLTVNDAIRFIVRGASGATDAVTCGDAMYVASRIGAQVRTSRVTDSASGTILQTVVEDGGFGRENGDVALACTSDGAGGFTLWSAFVDEDLRELYVASRTGPADPEASGAAAGQPTWSAPVFVDGDVRGGVTLAVVDGTVHLAYARNGFVCYASGVAP